ncbi:MAG: NUDIX domain-containing protein [Candidatus Nanoarchaeia archaeon]|nr:NUDIX domain-containing protein [Candidatus Nanoarchaeia archaeon]MDD5588020.1 NUDIX domain-containing protein [Candidatus Nanoarchaeia archaeon]
MGQRSVAIIIFYDSENRILMQSRKNISKHGEEWGFFGGGIELGETPEQALKREIKEELTYDIKEFKFFKKYGPTIYGDMKITYFVFLSKLPLISKFKQVEGDSMKLFTVKETKELKLVSGDYPILDDLEEFFKR